MIRVLVADDEPLAPPLPPPLAPAPLLLPLAPLLPVPPSGTGAFSSIHDPPASAKACWKSGAKPASEE